MGEKPRLFQASTLHLGLPNHFQPFTQPHPGSDGVNSEFLVWVAGGTPSFPYSFQSPWISQNLIFKTGPKAKAPEKLDWEGRQTSGKPGTSRSCMGDISIQWVPQV